MDNPETNLKWKRFGAALMDFILIPALVGILMGLLLHNGSSRDADKYFHAVSLGFVIFFQRDFIYSPGRHLFGLRLVDSKKGNLICFYQGNLFSNLIKGVVRNLLLFIPFVLVVGYIVEVVMVIWKGHRLMDVFAGVKVVEKTEAAHGTH